MKVQKENPRPEDCFRAGKAAEPNRLRLSAGNDDAKRQVHPWGHQGDGDGHGPPGDAAAATAVLD